MLRSSYKIASVWGIPIKVHISLLALLVFIAISSLKDAGLIELIFTLSVVVGVFTSIALHELGHSFVAIKKGCRVREITLMIIGGVAKMENIPSKPRDEFQMAIAGPMVSLVIGASCYFGGPFLSKLNLGMLGAIIHLVGYINFFLAGFNLIPAFPMDGGRVLRALLTPRFGKLRATFIASRLGKILAVALGIYAIVPPDVRPILVFIAIFIYFAAGQEYRMVQMQEAMKQNDFGAFFRGRNPFTRQQDTHQEPYYTHQDPSSDDQVIISPPPYEDGPDIQTDIHTEKDDPFGLFRR